MLVYIIETAGTKNFFFNNLSLKDLNFLDFIFFDTYFNKIYRKTFQHYSIMHNTVSLAIKMFKVSFIHLFPSAAIYKKDLLVYLEV